MLQFPETTQVNTRIPKQKFYENLSVKPAVKRLFVEQIKAIVWRNKIAPSTMNLAAGEAVTEIEVFEIKLNGPELDEAVLRQIDQGIPYHILFLLEYDGKYQAWTAYKEAAEAGNNAFKVGPYYHTGWLSEEALPLSVDGLDTDAVYEGFVRQIRGDSECGIRDSELSLRELVERDERRKQLQKQIAALQNKVRNEKQLNKQVQLNAELKRLKREIEEL